MYEGNRKENLRECGALNWIHVLIIKKNSEFCGSNEPPILIKVRNF
jgi:hypothetical protein